MYIIELLAMGIIFMLVGILLTPFLIGSLFLLIPALFVVAILFMIFSINIFWFLISIVVFYIFSMLYKYYKWNRLVDITKYLNTYPHCKLEHGVSCFRCNSKELNNEGLFNNKSKWRFYQCVNCGTVLFKTTVL